MFFVAEEYKDNHESTKLRKHERNQHHGQVGGTSSKSTQVQGWKPGAAHRFGEVRGVVN
jgi:hypothetical protein